MREMIRIYAPGVEFCTMQFFAEVEKLGCEKQQITA
jgi:hypothetical protein